jgi:transcriptional regulator GlxA family with amidase domain
MFEEPRPADPQRTAAWAWFFERVNQSTAARHDTLRRRLDAARRFLEDNLDQPVTLVAAARRAFLSKYHFLRLFKHTFHETPHHYLRRRRLEQAQRLLTRTDLPVTSVCLEVGFESLGSFSTLFRRSIGTPPATYRRRYITIPRAIVPPERLIPCCWLTRYGVAAAAEANSARALQLNSAQAPQF